MRKVKRHYSMNAVLVGLCMFIAACLPAQAESSIAHGNNQRTGYTDARVPHAPVLQWVYAETHPPRQAWREPNRELQYIDFDYATQVTVSDGLLIFGSSADHTVRALDLSTGLQRWHFYTEGPVRFAPAVAGDLVYVASDDGHLYALKRSDGALCWKFRGGPSKGKLIGNEQMISHWPARSGVLAEQGRLHFTAGMWSRDGVFIYCLNATDGSVIWRNDTSGFHFTSLPHSTGLAGVAPQGHLALHRGRLYVATGRGAPAYFDASTGEFLFYENGQGYKPHQEGGSRVMAWRDWVIFKRRAQHVEESVRYAERLAGPGITSGLYALNGKTGVPQWALTDKHVACAYGRHLILAGHGPVIKVDIQEVTQGYGQYWKKGKQVKPDDHILQHGLDYAWDSARNKPIPTWMSPLPYKKWQAEVGYVFTLLQAGKTILAGGRGQVSALDFESGKILWQHVIEGDARGIYVADGRIVVSSTAGKLYVFGEGRTGPARQVKRELQAPQVSGDTRARAEAILEAGGIRAGYAVVLGAGDGQLLCELARQSELILYCLEPDAMRAQRVRRLLDRAGLLGVRVAVHVGAHEQLPYSPYCANLLVWGQALGSGIDRVQGSELHRILRPYGGVAVQVRARDGADLSRRKLLDAGVPAKEIADSALGVVMTRGALPGAGQWTHAYADVGRSSSSEDTLARLPLGMLWWGGPGPARTVSRHWRAPVPLFSNGTLFIQGQHDVIAVDAYNGRELWNRHLEGVGRFPPSNRGGNIVADDDSVHCIQGTSCLRLDAQTGRTRMVYELPLDAQDQGAINALLENKDRSAQTRVVWEYLGLSDDYLIGSLGNEELYERMPNAPYYKAVQQARILFVFRKSTGELLWRRQMERAVSPMAIVADSQRLYYLDRTAKPAFKLESRRSAEGIISVLHARRLATGEALWQKPGIRSPHKSLLLKDDVLVTYPNPIEHEILAGDAGVAVYSALNGELLWERQELAGVSGGGRGAVIRHTFVIGDTLFLPWAYDLHTGQEKLLHTNPLTGEQEPFKIDGQNFCGTVAAGQHLLAYRSASIGFQEVSRDSGSFWLPELRASCWISVLPAGGLVLAPEGYATCICPYNYKTSVALMPVERYEDWAVYLSGNKYALQQRKKKPKQLDPAFRHLHLNLGAPGDRIDEQGRVWLTMPRPTTRIKKAKYLDTAVPVTISGETQPYHLNADTHAIKGTKAPWLFTSGVEGPVEITVNTGEKQKREFRVELLFAETDQVETGGRVFDVVLQGETVLANFDIMGATGQHNRACVRTIHDVHATDKIVLQLAPVAGKMPRLCGLAITECH